jgi:hypothetical protein
MGKSKDPKKNNIFDERNASMTAAKKLAMLTEKNLSGKRMVPHPTMKKTYIYV